MKEDLAAVIFLYWHNMRSVVFLASGPYKLLRVAMKYLEVFVLFYELPICLYSTKIAMENFVTLQFGISLQDRASKLNDWLEQSATVSVDGRNIEPALY